MKADGLIEAIRGVVPPSGIICSSFPSVKADGLIEAVACLRGVAPFGAADEFPSVKADGLIEAMFRCGATSRLVRYHWFPSVKADGLIEALQLGHRFRSAARVRVSVGESRRPH